jgi:hypothetical protein
MIEYFFFFVGLLVFLSLSDGAVWHDLTIRSFFFCLANYCKFLTCTLCIVVCATIILLYCCMYYYCMYCMDIMLYKGLCILQDVHINCHMFTVTRIACIVLGTCPVVVWDPDVRLRITCGAEAKTTGLGTPWKWYKRETPSDNLSFVRIIIYA